jgi:hypothetical protein
LKTCCLNSTLPATSYCRLEGAGGITAVQAARDVTLDGKSGNATTQTIYLHGTPLCCDAGPADLVFINAPAAGSMSTFANTSVLFDMLPVHVYRFPEGSSSVGSYTAYAEAGHPRDRSTRVVRVVYDHYPDTPNPMDFISWVDFRDTPTIPAFVQGAIGERACKILPSCSAGLHAPIARAASRAFAAR